jgi:uncharacterized protein
MRRGRLWVGVLATSLVALSGTVAQAASLVLVADDVADTGLTLASVHDFCAGKVGAVRTATIYAKPRSVVRPDYVWRHTDRWITFPWSDRPPVTGRGVLDV